MEIGQDPAYKRWPVRFKKNRDQKNITLNQLCLT